MKKNVWLVVLSICVLTALVLAACSPAVASPDPNAAKPSKEGPTGKALTLKGDPASGKAIFDSNCASCHGPEGKGGVDNPGSEDGTVPPLNPIDETLVNKDAKVFAANLDLFLEHGSTPAGSSPSKMMLPFGDSSILEPQQIADVIAYVISLNQK